MRKTRWIMIQVLTWTLLVCLIVSIPKAIAGVNLMENGSVLYAWIKNPNELRAYIDEDGLSASDDELKKGEYSNTYKIIVDEPGQLVFAPLTNEYFVSLYLYSDFGLTSQVAKIDGIKSSQETLGLCEVNAGTYYYRLSGHGEGKVSVFIGFVPDSGIINNIWSHNNNTVDYEGIKPIQISTTDELASYIDHDGDSNSQDLVEKGQISDTYQFTVSNPGVLVIAPICPEIGVTFRLFSNSDLSSRLLECDSIISSMDGMKSVELQPGTYYYNVHSDYYAASISVYMGFIENEDSRMDRYVAEVDHSDETAIARINNIEAFKQQILDGDFTYSDKITKAMNSEKRKIVLDETSLLYIFSTADKMGVNLHLCSDNKLVSCLNTMESKEQNQNNHTVYSLLLDPGEYYLYSFSQYYDAKTYVYLGYVPSSDMFSVKSIHLSDDKTSAVVEFNIAEEYNPDEYKGMIRIEKGIVRARSIGNKAIWKDDTRENAIESHEFIATENGIYTARLSGNELQTYLLTFEVTGIGGEGPEPEQQAEPEENQPVEQATEEPVPTEEPHPMSASEMRKYIRMLEDQIEDLGLELPEFSAESTQEEYMQQLEKVLHDNGYDL